MHCVMYGLTEKFQHAPNAVSGDKNCVLTTTTTMPPDTFNAETHPEFFPTTLPVPVPIANDPLTLGQNATTKDQIASEQKNTNDMVSELSLYCCCEPLKRSKDWQYNLFVEVPVPNYCKKSWFMSYCLDLNNVYSPSSAVRDMAVDLQTQMDKCDMCNECFSKECPFWAEDQQPMNPEWIQKITCDSLKKEANVVREEEAIGDRENEDVNEADACASEATKKNKSFGDSGDKHRGGKSIDEAVNGTKCPDKVEEVAKQAPWLLILLLFLILSICCFMGGFAYWRYKLILQKQHKAKLLAEGKKQFDSSDEENEAEEDGDKKAGDKKTKAKK